MPPGKLIQFLSVRPQFNAHRVITDDDGIVTSVEDMSHSDVRINGGFFVCRRELLDWIEPGDELVEETFARLIPRGEVVAFPYEGFFGPMDTIKDRQRLEGMHESGRAPWRIVGLARGARAEAGLMLALSLFGGGAPLRRVLAIGCHADDVEIGCGGTLLALTREPPDLEVTWVVLGAEGDRAAEARASAEAFLASARAPRSSSTGSGTRTCRTTASRSRRPSRS